ncbi:MAG: 50S ribosomal protein L21e [Candidatus Marsarchaeota archaeon]|jgi:large subunit ribosomal protein L21e|nr:50S ribosomal protein L21e [Candidatus Marsarchaeota archaeon]
MTERSHGLFVGRTRHLSRHHKPSGLGITRFIKNFEVGNKVVIVPKSNMKNIPHPRYRGRIGVVVEKRGGAYVVEFNVSRSMKRKVIVPQVHLEKA